MKLLRDKFFGPGAIAATSFLLLLCVHAWGQTGFGPNVSGAGTYGPPFQVQGGHLSIAGGNPPTANASCGGTPVQPVGSDTSFFFTSGTSPTSSCALTFATPWHQAPSCSVDSQSGTTPAYNITATAINLTGVAAGTVYNFLCIGQPGG
jgi:hypothetical protein